MKKILAFSDSHNECKKMIDIINENLDIDFIIFLGDGIKDIEEVGMLFPDIKIISVVGNNDFRFDIPTERVIEIEGKKILMTHGHTYNVKNGDTHLLKRAKELGVQIVFYGHTHKCREEILDNILFINPGSIGNYPYNYKKLIIP